MQTQINPALAAAMTLERAAQVGEFQPMTPQGQPTVAAQLMQKAMPPAVPQVAQQAGLAAQIQAMQQQQAQQAMMQQAMAQRPPAGIEGLSPQMGNFAEGGIVGYAGGGGAREEMNPLTALIRKLAELELPTRAGSGVPQDAIAAETARVTQAPVSEIPVPEIVVEDRPSEASAQQRQAASALANVPMAPAGKQPGAESPSAGMFNAARAMLGNVVTEPVAPEQGIAGAMALGRAQDELRRQMGLPTQMDLLGRQEEEYKRLFGEREKRIGERLSQIEQERGQQGIINFLLGARGMRGQGIGETFRTGAESARAYEEGARAKMEKLQDLQMEIQALSMEKRNALDKMRDDIANGRFSSAMSAKEKAQEAQNALNLKQSELYKEQAKELGSEWRARLQAQQQPGEIERMMSTYQRLLKTSPQAAQEYLDTVGVLRGAGRRPAPAELRSRVLEQYADNWEKMDLMEKKQLVNQGIKTYEDYVKYRDRIAGVAPTAAPSGGASGDLLKRADAIVGGR